MSLNFHDVVKLHEEHKKDRMCDKHALELMVNYIPLTVKDDEKQIGVRHVPTFHRNVLFRVGEWAKIYAGGVISINKDVPCKTIETCLIGWGMSKFLTVPEYMETIKTRQSAAANCDSREELQVYTCAVKEVFGDDLIDVKTKEAKLHVSRAQFEYISKTASTIGMTEGQFALYLMYLAVKYIPAEDYENSEFKPKEWETKSISKMVSDVDEHIRTLWIDIERYRKIQEVRGKSLL